MPSSLFKEEIAGNEVPTNVGYFIMRQLAFLNKYDGRDITDYITAMGLSEQYQLLRKTYLCNNWKELDAGSVYLIETVWNNDSLSYSEKIRESIIYRTFNRPYAYEFIFKDYTGKYIDLLPQLMEDRFLFNYDAYLLRSGWKNLAIKLRMFDNPKLAEDCRRIGEMVADGECERAQQYMIDTRYEGWSIFGPFTAYHLICDITYWGNELGVRNKSEYRGPGAAILNRLAVGLKTNDLEVFIGQLNRALDELGIKMDEFVPNCNGDLLPFDTQFAQFFSCEIRKYVNKLVEKTNRKDYTKSHCKRKNLLQGITIPLMPSMYKLGGKDE